MECFPYIGISLNIDGGRLDYYKDIDHINKDFTKFASLMPEDGYLIGDVGDIIEVVVVFPWVPDIATLYL